MENAYLLVVNGERYEYTEQVLDKDFHERARQAHLSFGRTVESRPSPGPGRHLRAGLSVLSTLTGELNLCYQGFSVTSLVSMLLPSPRGAKSPNEIKESL